MAKERTTIWVRVITTAAGRMALAATEKGLLLTTLPGRENGEVEALRAARVARVRATAIPDEVAGTLDAAEAALTGYYSSWPDYPGEEIRDRWAALLALPVDLDGLTAFTRRVLELLRRVPPGSTISYAVLAARAGSPRAARAVGSVMARNPLPIVLPCHRVVASDGGLGGFAGETKGEALAFKERLLRYEGWRPGGESA